MGVSRTRRMSEKGLLHFYLVVLLLFAGQAKAADGHLSDSLQLTIQEMSNNDLIKQLFFYKGYKVLSQKDLKLYGGYFYNHNNQQANISELSIMERPLFCVDADRIPSHLQTEIHPRSFILQAQSKPQLLNRYFNHIWPKLASKNVDIFFTGNHDKVLFPNHYPTSKQPGIIIGQKIFDNTQPNSEIIWTTNPETVATPNSYLLFNTNNNLLDNNLLKSWKNGAIGFVVNENVQLVSNELLTHLQAGAINRTDLINRVTQLAQLKLKLLKPTEFKHQNSFDLLDLELRANSITLLGDHKNNIPIALDTKTYIWAPYSSMPFHTQLKKYTSQLQFLENREQLLSLFGKQIVIVVNQRLKTTDLEELKELSIVNKITLINFGIAEQSAQLTQISTVVQLYANSKHDQQLAAQAICGGRKISGHYPAILRQQYKPNSPDTKRERISLQYPLHEDKMLNTQMVDKLVNEAIQSQAFPGCQVVAIHKGKMVLNKSYGHHTYAQKQAVRSTDLYDLASVTKVAGTTLALMHLYGENELDLFAPLGQYLKAKEHPYIKQNLHHNNLFNSKIYELMAHRSGIRPYLPIYEYVFYKTVNRKHHVQKVEEYIPAWIPRLDGNLSGANKASFHYNAEIKDPITSPFPYFYTHEKSNRTYNRPIADKMYFKKAFHDSLVLNTLLQPVYTRKRYKYSDINFVLLQMVADSISGMKMNTLLSKNIYRKLGLQRMLYHPLSKFATTEITPTENDTLWRNQLVHGYVHDPSAALMGGMTGNAGLFSNAEDLAKLGQMLIQKGRYGKEQVISEKVVEIFTKPQKLGKRGLGFDTALRTSLVGSMASNKTYGHTGFTGTCIWVDPVNDLVYVFLSNRIHPSVENKKLQRMHVRERIHDAIYSTLKLSNISR